MNNPNILGKVQAAMQVSFRFQLRRIRCSCAKFILTSLSWIIHVAYDLQVNSHLLLIVPESTIDGYGAANDEKSNGESSSPNGRSTLASHGHCSVLTGDELDDVDVQR